MEKTLTILSPLTAFGAVTLLAYIGTLLFRRQYARYEERYLRNTAAALDEMFVFLPAEQILYLRFLCALVFAVGGFLAALGRPLPLAVSLGVALGAIGFLLPQGILKRLAEKRRRKFEEQLGEALPVVSNALKAGLSLPQAIDLVVREMEKPISQEFGLVLKENRLGSTLEEALAHLSRRIRSEDLDLMVGSILVVREIGGNLTEIFDRIAETVRQRRTLQGKVDALTSQGKLQGIIVGLMPIALGAILFLIQPALMRPLFTTAVGWAALSAVIVLEILGALTIRKIVTIDV